MINHKYKGKMQNPLTSNNVIQLNRISGQRLLNAEQTIEAAKNLRIDLVDDVTEIVIENIKSIYFSTGIIDNERLDGRDLMMIEQSIQASLYRYYGLEHPLHEIIETTFDISESDGEE